VGAPIDLFAAASAEGAWTVTEVTRRARVVIEAGLPPLWIRGEVTGFKAWRSGHWYFSLRDRFSQIRCVMFHNDNRRLPAPPTEGMQVFAFAQPSVYEAKGEFQLTIKELLSTEQGGLWKLAFEKARAALQKDGLLDPARKRRLPLFPRRIAVVTSPDGAALRDIEAVITRRWPIAELVLVAAKVQGDGAEASVCAALARLGKLEVDVAIVGRGGGSAEDLWTFNSERVARALAAVPVPVISAVGHETDVTLCDLVADVRAPTPSAAAEAATPDRAEVLVHLGHLGERLARGLAQRSQRAVDRLDRTLKILARGYAVARDEKGRVLKRVKQLPSGQAFRLRVTDGEVAARVSSPPDPLSVPERGNERGVSSPLSRRERGPGGEDGSGAEV